MSAASQAKRMRKDDLEVVALERSHYTSYSACGIPYWVGGEVDGDRLVARTPEQHRANGIDLRMRIAVESVDLDTQTIKTRNVDTGTAGEEGFDHLVIATGRSQSGLISLASTRSGSSGCKPLTTAERLSITSMNATQSASSW